MFYRNWDDFQILAVNEIAQGYVILRTPRARTIFSVSSQNVSKVCRENESIKYLGYPMDIL
ncbi:MAG: hypothetical protein CO088_02940 [Candidatus Yonathbacteria bacterium CG_4_9_14_0_8_um_filter_46_47]|uniref:Uncharacterized protein n=1 Tax=Candidatus Yonathbacteria bacterium CG_4_9_14_0_8_um_filter_46_47 TaxID=1975106 RepID=A0A2M8D6X0_9BACT|nr:MAG: hypothetical protein CO088_02940 [Candidatus Yonathbacteria bacterium CG_4_9_14_0_8_um_filter_46_47]